jgi:hypothetical protein
VTWEVVLCKHVWTRWALWLILIARGVKVYAVRRSELRSLKLVRRRQSWQSGQAVIEWSVTVFGLLVALYFVWYTLMPVLTEIIHVALWWAFMTEWS